MIENNLEITKDNCDIQLGVISAKTLAVTDKKVSKD